MKISDLAKEVQSQFDKLEVEKVEMKFEDSRNYRVSSDKAKKAFGFKPQFAPADGVSELKKLLEEGRIRNLANPLYWNELYLSNFKTHQLFERD